MKFCERLKEIRTHLELNQSELAGKLSIAISTYQYYERGDRTMPQDVITRLITLFNINPVWLLTGDGEMFNSDEVFKRVEKANNIGNFIAIKYFPEVKASAGGGAFNENEEFEPFLIDKSLISNPEKEVVINVTGDSMSPSLNNGDKVLVNIATIDNFIIDNIYAVLNDGTLFVKRYAGVIRDSYVFSSDNKIYQNIYMMKNDENNIIMGAVKRIVDRKLQ